MGILKNMAANRQKRVETRNNRKIEIKKAEFASNNVAYENGVTPAASDSSKWSAAATTGLGIVKGFLGQKNPDALPLPDGSASQSPNKLFLIGGGLLGLGVIFYLIKKK